MTDTIESKEAKKQENKTNNTVVQNDETVADFEGMYKRALADYQNLQKTTAKEKEEFARYIKANLIMEFIPIYEHLNLAVDHADAEKENGKVLAQEVESVVLGIKAILSQFEKILQESGIDIINKVNVEFNPREHDAVTKVPTDEKESINKVAMIIKPGYRLGGKTIQPAKVAVYGDK